LAIEYDVWSFQTVRGDGPELSAKAVAALDKAKHLKPDIAYIPMAQSFFENDIEGKAQLLLKALSLDPNFNEAKRILGIEYRRFGRFAEAQHYLEELARIDPLNEKSMWYLANVYRERRMLDQAMEIIERALERNKDESSGNINWRFDQVEVSYLQSGDRQSYLDGLKALPNFQENPGLVAWHAIVSRDYPVAREALSSGFGRVGNLSRTIVRTLLEFISSEEPSEDLARITKEGMSRLQESLESNQDAESDQFSEMAIYLALLGNREEVEASVSKTRELTRLDPFDKKNLVQTEFRIAIAYLVLGDNDKAIETLEAASQVDGPVYLNRELDLWFIFDRLRGNPRFDNLLED